MAELVAETPHPPDGNVGGDPKIPDPNSDPGEDERAPAGMLPETYDEPELYEIYPEGDYPFEESFELDFEPGTY